MNAPDFFVLLFVGAWAGASFMGGYCAVAAMLRNGGEP